MPVDAVARQEPESHGGVTLAAPHCGTQCHRKLPGTDGTKQDHILWKDRGKRVDGRNVVLRINLCHYSAQGAHPWRLAWPVLLSGQTAQKDRQSRLCRQP